MIGSEAGIVVLCGLLVAVQAGAALCLAAHGAAWAHLLWLWHRSCPLPPRPPRAGDDAPRVLLQLPLYNEESVVDGLLDAVAALDWPRSRLEVQVLDDSSDGTPARVSARLPGLRAAGLSITHVRRGSRAGFKAGALAAGLERSTAPLVAILDADFRPRPEWLRRAVAWMDPDVGLVQCRWSFLNPRDSLLTRAQALHLDAHFALEQQARSAGGLWMGFNGTAGVWRRSAIEAAGGWEGDTLTEDLDLSYRAQRAGQTLRYVDGIDVPCELPDSLAAVRAQQHRWIRGGAQVARKLLRSVWSGDASLRVRIQCTLHLLASSLFLPVVALCLAQPLVVLVQPVAPPWFSAALAPVGLALRPLPVLLVGAYGVVCAHRARSVPRGLLRMLRDFPVFLALVTAISAHNARAAWLGWRGPTGTFVRTPKGGERARVDRLPEAFAVEVLLAVSSCGLAIGALLWGDGLSALWLGFQAAGFSTLVAWTLAERRPGQREAPARTMGATSAARRSAP